ncbi:DUF2398 family protein [Streptomyces sp. NPDC056323]|uniref:DUF2398 family protein n=1 Tax=unclassified Streptomyces TaxID=2593676 RepID=UPI0035DA95D5
MPRCRTVSTPPSCARQPAPCSSSHFCSRGRYADEFRLARQHASDLRKWFGRNTGWVLQVDTEAPRLRKSPGDLTDPTHPARDTTRGATPFTRRRYVLLCFAPAALEGGEAQIALGCLNVSVRGWPPEYFG